MMPGTSIALNRMGYGAMQLAGPQVWGPPRNPSAAITILREAALEKLTQYHTYRRITAELGSPPPRLPMLVVHFFVSANP